MHPNHTKTYMWIHIEGIGHSPNQIQIRNTFSVSEKATNNVTQTRFQEQQLSSKLISKREASQAGAQVPSVITYYDRWVIWDHEMTIRMVGHEVSIKVGDEMSIGMVTFVVVVVFVMRNHWLRCCRLFPLQCQRKVRNAQVRYFKQLTKQNHRKWAATATMCVCVRERERETGW